VSDDKGTLLEDVDKGVEQMDRADGNYADVALRKVGGGSELQSAQFAIVCTKYTPSNFERDLGLATLKEALQGLRYLEAAQGVDFAVVNSSYGRSYHSKCPIYIHSKLEPRPAPGSAAEEVNRRDLHARCLSAATWVPSL
jgi:hypothetical protein